MSAQHDAPAAAGPLANGTGAVLISLVYGLAGPPIGAILLAPLAGLVEGQTMPYALLGGLLLLVENLPLSLMIAYHSAGLVALFTGIVVAAAARRGAVPYRMAGAVAVAVFLSFQLLSQMTGFRVPGAAVVQGASGGSGEPLLLVVSIVASLVCCLLTRPIQRRSR